MRSLLTVSATFILLVVMTLALSVEARRPKWHQLEGYSFQQYQKDFGKKYTSTEETLLREKQFNEKLAEIKAHNNAGHSWKKGVNKFTDFFASEIRRMNGGQAGNVNPKLKEALDNRPHVKKFKSSGSSVPLPASVNWRDRTPSVLSAVKDQGFCGSCWAHAATENIESYYAIATGNMFALSQQEITACAPNPDQCGGTGGCGGSIAELAFDYVKDHGVAQEWTNPYTAYQGTTGTCSNTTTPEVWLDGYVRVEKNSQQDVMEVLATIGPLAVNVDASKWNDYESGVYSGCGDYTTKNITIDHVVQLVGYGHDDGLNMDYWLIRNSWSPTFGENGFIRLFKNKGAPACGTNTPAADGTGCMGGPTVQHACGECGVLMDTSYPIVKV